ncbi:MAG TPA: S8 family serine peptidase, partial [Deinococcales bacterium]|nr:S8 family serine peptidase [Deinococcales bacterium]
PGSNDIDLQLEFIPVDPDDDKAAMTGVLRLPGGLGNASIPSGSAAVLDLQALSLTGAAPEAGQPAEVPLPASAPAEPEAMPGEIIVRFRDTELSAQSVPASLSTTGVRLELLQAGDAGSLYRAPSLSSAETIALAEELAARPDVKSATPNWILHAFAKPNDEHYELQWHYDAINLPAAWDVTTGSSDVTVAVLDSGSIEHPDLDFLDGYDFISDPDLSGDNRSRNSDPEDPGIGSNYHGAHVAGTIGATTDNGVGVAGVSWDVGIVPVRVLGVDGKGALFDVLDGASWAAGNNVPGAPSNNHPADVINLSLGFSSGLTCKEVLGTDDDSFFADLDAITVVAAGNDGIDTRGVFPANCPGVITVGATGAENEQTSYSNFGPEVDVMAPGGSTSASFTRNGRTYPYQVLSTILDANEQPDYGFSVGTSMAAPHVSGVIALLLSEEPGLSFSEVRDRLQNSASSVTCSSGGCGSG